MNDFIRAFMRRVLPPFDEAGNELHLGLVRHGVREFSGMVTVYYGASEISQVGAMTLTHVLITLLMSSRYIVFGLQVL